jgi:hypothetical protein
MPSISRLKSAVLWLVGASVDGTIADCAIMGKALAGRVCRTEASSNVRFNSLALAPSISASTNELVARFPDGALRRQLLKNVPDRPGTFLLPKWIFSIRELRLQLAQVPASSMRGLQK